MKPEEDPCLCCRYRSQSCAYFLGGEQFDDACLDKRRWLFYKQGPKAEIQPCESSYPCPYAILCSACNVRQERETMLKLFGNYLDNADNHEGCPRGTTSIHKLVDFLVSLGWVP